MSIIHHIEDVYVNNNNDIDEEKKTVSGTVDLGTVYFNDNWGNFAGFKSHYTCRYKNYFLDNNAICSYEEKINAKTYYAFRVLPNGQNMKTKKFEYSATEKEEMIEFCKHCNISKLFFPSDIYPSNINSSNINL